MNVLGKIVIPRLLMSIAYILSEIEEKAREEFFRMKKIVQLNRKRRMKLVEGDQKFTHDCETCVLCSALMKEVSFASETPQVITEQPGQIDEFKKQISEIISAAKELEQQHLIEEARGFVKQAEELQAQLQVRKKFAEEVKTRKRKIEFDKDIECPEVIPPDVDYERLCAKCQLAYINQHGTPCLVEMKVSPPSSPAKFSCISTSQEKAPCLPETAQLMYSPAPSEAKEFKEAKIGVKSYVKEYEEVTEDDEGVFETEIEVITKVVRNIHPDGTITEDKKVIKIRRETKKPMPKSNDRRKGRLTYQRSDTSYESRGPYGSTKNVGYVVPGGKTPFRDLYSYSETLSGSSSLCYPLARYCVSIPNIICSSDFDVGKGVIEEFKNLSEKFEAALDQFKKPKWNNITTLTEYHSTLSQSDTMLLSLLSEETNFNLNNTSHLSLYKEIMVTPIFKHKSCIDLSYHPTNMDTEN